MSLHHLFYPRGVAVVGSTSEGKIGYELIRQILDGGFCNVFAVNPKAQGALGIPGYAAIAHIKEPIDLVVIVSPAPTVAAVLQDAGKAGVPAAVIITAGFSEAGNAAGEEELKQIARQNGIRLVGPNCAGMINTAHRLYASLETRPPAGKVAFISQSGAMGGAVLSWAEEQGLGFSKFLSTGNRADLDEIELLPYLARDDQTQVAALYIESVSDGRAFLQSVREFTRIKPLVVIKAGRGTAGQRATLSHTGSMAGAFAVYDAALRDSGALRVDTVEEMFDLCKGLVSLPRFDRSHASAPELSRKPSVAIVTNSGGPGVMAADRAEELSLAVSEPSPALKARLEKFLPSHCSLKNPFDLTVEGTEAGYRETLCAVLEEYDAGLALDVSTPYLDSAALARGVCAAAETTVKPVVANFMAGRIVADAIGVLEAHGIPNYPIAERALAVLARIGEYESFRSTERTWPEIPQTVRPLPFKRQMLEPEAMQWLSDNSVPTLPFRHAQSESEALRGCREIGYPVAMKVVSPDILHKSELGGVKLNVGDESEASAAFRDLERVAAGKVFRGVIILPMVQGAQEVLLGLSRDPQFGPVVVFGLGGIFTEVWRDVALRIAPVDRGQAESMIREIRSFPILNGVRGRRPCDLGALADLLVKLSQLPFVYPEIGALDLNPVFAQTAGVRVGDVRVLTNESPTHADRTRS